MSESLQRIGEAIWNTTQTIWGLAAESCFRPLVAKASDLIKSISGVEFKSNKDFRTLTGTELADDDEAEVITDEQIKRMTQKSQYPNMRNRNNLASAGAVFDDEDDEDADTITSKPTKIINSKADSKQSGMVNQTQTATVNSGPKTDAIPDLLGVDKVLTDNLI